MQIAFDLRRGNTTAATGALLLLSHSSGDLARFRSAMKWQRLPPLFAVADGILLVLPQPATGHFAGALRLRALARNLYIPVDADLVPSLLPDEAAALTRHRGIVFLPGNRVLEFDPGRPVPLSAIISVDHLERGAWQPLPEASQLAERLSEISLQAPELPPDDLIDSGGEDIGTEESLSDHPNLPARALGKTAFGAGKALAWLGSALGLKGLARTGMKWMEAGLGMSPRMAKSVFGNQEAKLRALLKAFRDGDVDRALRRALPLNPNIGRGGVAANNANLPFHKLLYSLRNLLGESGGRHSVWNPHFDLYAELSREYRRQAALAVERGDYRRAAFIHAKLLHDFAAAAAVLAKGGLHRDAALIYLRRVGDTLAAAREYEAAGEVDRALALYHQRGDHLQAGDLLRRSGEEERALAEFDLAARHALRSGRGYLEAGEIMRLRAGREDLALPFYQTGWAERPMGNPLPCARRLAIAYASAEDAEKLMTLTSEAEVFLDPPGNDLQAAEFYDHLAELTDNLREPRIHDQFRDLALMGVARKLRQRVRAGANTSAVTSSMLSSLRAWPDTLMNDAQYAVRQSFKVNRTVVKQQSPSRQAVVPARVPVVTAICNAVHSGDVFLGFDSGEVVCLSPNTSEIIAITDEHSQILSLAATQDGDALVVLTSSRPGEITLKSFVRNVTFAAKGSISRLDAAGLELCLNLAGDAQRFMLATWTDTQFEFMEGPQFVPTCHAEFGADTGFAQAVLLLSSSHANSASIPLLVVSDRQITHWENPPWPVTAENTQYIGFGLGSSVGSSLLRHFLSWGNAGKWLELAGVTSDGDLYVSAIRLDNQNLHKASINAIAGSSPYLTAAVIGPDRFAGVTRNAIHWLRRGTGGLHIISKTEIELPSAIAAFRNPRGKELLVISADGTFSKVTASGL